jgi:predicted nucleic acid-binding protein
MNILTQIPRKIGQVKSPLQEVSRQLAKIGSSGSFATRLTVAAGDLHLEVQGVGEVLVPVAVWQEITHIPSFSSVATHQAATEARTAGWLRIATANNRPLVTQLETVLDSGEAEAIALAVECKPSLLLIDERDGRQVARTLNVPLTGGGALLTQDASLVEPHLLNAARKHFAKTRSLAR